MTKQLAALLLALALGGCSNSTTKLQDQVDTLSQRITGLEGRLTDLQNQLDLQVYSNAQTPTLPDAEPQALPSDNH